MLDCNGACKKVMRNLYCIRENTLHALQQEGRNLGMRRPLVTEMVMVLFAKIPSWNVVNCCIMYI